MERKQKQQLINHKSLLAQKRIRLFIVATITAAVALCISLMNTSYAADKVTNKTQTGNPLKEFYPTYPKPILHPGDNVALIKKGEYLVRIGDCISCHTNTPGGGKNFAGGLPIHTPFGTFFTPNITPDKKTGIGNWTTDDFINAMHDGINPEGQNYFPVFPYTSFTKINKDDLIAIKAYLDHIQPVYQKDKAPTAPWPFSWRFAQIFWKWMFFKAEYYHYDHDHSKQWNRGAYLVQGLGHCGECHTPRNLLGAMKQKYYLTGAFIDGYWAPDITGIEFSDTPHGEVVDVFDRARLINKAGPVRGPMDEVDHNSLMQLNPYDLDAIALYLKSVKSPQPRLPDGIKGKANYEAGRKVYKDVCAMCHDKGIAGAPMIYDTYNWDMRLKKGGIDNLYMHAINGYNNMPPKGGCVTCNDADVKAAVNYILSQSQDASAAQRVSGSVNPKPDTSYKRGKLIYQNSCAVCHDSGHLGAEKLTDKQAWHRLLEKNLDTLIVNTIKGIGNMPPKGGCNECSTSDIIAAVKYMAKTVNPEGDYSLW